MKIYVVDESYLPFLDVKLFTQGDFIFALESNTVTMYSVNSTDNSTDKHFDVNNGTLGFLYRTDNYKAGSNFGAGFFTFEFYGADKRKGDITVINFLKGYFKDEPVVNFLENALEILNYKKDQWDATVLMDLFNYKSPNPNERTKSRKSYKSKNTTIPGPTSLVSSTNEAKVYKPLTPINIEVTKPVSSYQATEYLFFDYMSAGCRDLWKKKEKEGKELREIFGLIMSERKDEYRQSFKAFIKDNPSLSIYSKKKEKKDEAPKKQDSKKEYKRCSGFDFIYTRLEQRGYEQISDTEWVNKLGERYVIDIHELTDKSMLYANIDEDEEVNATVSTESFDDDIVILAENQEEVSEETGSTEENKEGAVEEGTEEDNKVLNETEEQLNNQEEVFIEVSDEEKPQKSEDGEPSYKSNKLTSYDISRLRHIFDHTQTSYKYLWFCSILLKIRTQKSLIFNCNSIAISMLELAWPYCDNIKLTMDRFPLWKKELIKCTGLNKSSSPINISSTLQRKRKDPNISTILREITKVVSIRFLSVWIQPSKENDVQLKSQEFDNNCLYSIFRGKKDFYISVNPIWQDFLIKNNKVLFDYSYKCFIRTLDLYDDQTPMSDLKFPIEIFNYSSNVPVIDFSKVGSKKDQVSYFVNSKSFNDGKFMILGGSLGYYLWNKNDGVYYLS